MKPPTRRRMALQCPQGSSAPGHTRPGMCTAVMADPATFPCHGEGELPARPVTNFGACRRYAMVRHAIGGTHARITTPMAGQVGSWGIQQDPSSRVEPPRSIATHQKPQLGSAKFGAKQPKSSTRGRFEGVMHGHEAPHTPTNGLAVSPGIIRSRPHPPRHVYCGHGRPSHLPVPWGRRTSGTAGHQFWRLQTIRDGAPCNRRDPRPHQNAHGRSSGVLGHPARPFRHAWNPPVPSPHTKNPSSEVPNLVQSSPNPARAGGLRV